MSDTDGPVLYVLVIGFHHKKGCQVEYSFPPLVAGAPNECPPGWKYLPTLALPDGSHNYDHDTVYFHLPSLTKPRQTIYGISCFRQIPIEKLKNVTADITRGTVQKSVCVLSKIPYYGHIQVKMALITHAYFDEGDFSKVSLLEDTYHHLNSVLLLNESPAQSFVGLSARDFILQWKHKAVLLFKLLLLEKRVVFYKSPVHPLCTTILTLLSLHPGMIESGLDESASIRLSRPMSPMPNYSDDDATPDSSPRHANKAHFTYGTNIVGVNQNFASGDNNDNKHSISNIPPTSTDQISGTGDVLSAAVTATDDEQHCVDPAMEYDRMKPLVCCLDKEIGTEVSEATNEELNKEGIGDSLRRDNSTDAMEYNMVANNMAALALIKSDQCGFPLPIFKQGYLCLPYLSLSYMDLMTDLNVRGYIVGATNVLFKQKRQLYDVLVDIESGRIECHQDADVRKQLHLTTEDLRFADYIVRHVSEEKHDVFLDGVGFEGGDEWIRTQFKIYLLCLLRTSQLQEGNREIENFNSTFMSAWKDSYNYKMWSSADSPAVLDVSPGHPFAGQLSVSDMKLRLSHTMSNTEGGRKINQAMATTGRAVATTSKAVGGALSHAKGAVSSWFSNFLVSPATNECPSLKNDSFTVATVNESSNALDDSKKNNQEPTQKSPDTILPIANTKKEKNIVNGLIVEEVKNAEKCLNGLKNEIKIV